MSMAALERITSELPSALQDQVLGYARSVELQVDEMVDGRVPVRRQDLIDAVVLISGLRKLRSIIAMASSMAQFAESQLRADGVDSITSGRMTVGGRSMLIGELRALEADVDRVLDEVQVAEYMNPSYTAVVEALIANGY